MALHRNFINGEWLEGKGVRENINPSDLSDIVGEYAQADKAQTETAIAAAKAAQPAWAAATPQVRADALEFIGTELLARKDEIGRLLSHLLNVTTQAMDVGALTPPLWGFEQREKLMVFYERACGARLHANYFRPGGVHQDLPEALIADIDAWCLAFPSYMRDMDDLITGNRIFKQRNVDIGVVTRQEALDWGFSGVMVRGSGIAWDLRRNQPYECYDELEFDIPLGKNGDCYDRYLCRMEEMRQSVRIMRQCVAKLAETPGPVMTEDHKVVPPRRADMKDILNLKIKRRESFRPFAPSILREAVLGADGICSAGKPAILCDLSTSGPQLAVELAAALPEVACFDAPVSGGTAAADAGTLAFMVGCAEADFADVEEALKPMARVVIRAGETGAGQAAKICNNMLLAISMIGTCEAFALAEKLGLEADRFSEIASKSSGQCWSLTTYAPWPGVGPQTASDRNYEGGFATAMMLKDLKLAQEAAARSGATTPLGNQAEAIYALFDRLGFGGKDFSGVLQLLRGDLASLKA